MVSKTEENIFLLMTNDFKRYFSQYFLMQGNQLWRLSRILRCPWQTLWHIEVPGGPNYETRKSHNHRNRYSRCQKNTTTLPRCQLYIRECSLHRNTQTTPGGPVRHWCSNTETEAQIELRTRNAISEIEELTALEYFKEFKNDQLDTTTDAILEYMKA